MTPDLDLLTRENEELRERLVYWAQAYCLLNERLKSITSGGCSNSGTPDPSLILPAFPEKPKPTASLSAPNATLNCHCAAPGCGSAARGLLPKLTASRELDHWR